ncbi:hypothetical protein Dimus_034211 [Dionaea muscipula]
MALPHEEVLAAHGLTARAVREPGWPLAASTSWLRASASVELRMADHTWSWPRGYVRDCMSIPGCLDACRWSWAISRFWVAQWPISYFGFDDLDWRGDGGGDDISGGDMVVVTCGVAMWPFAVELFAVSVGTFLVHPLGYPVVDSAQRRVGGGQVERGRRDKWACE